MGSNRWRGWEYSPRSNAKLLQQAQQYAATGYRNRGPGAGFTPPQTNG